jgi:phosphate uptake regulator
MKGRKEIHLLRERVAALEAHVVALEEHLRSFQARSHQTDRTVERIYERTADMLRIAWEVLRTSRPDALLRLRDEDLARETGRSPE